MTRGGVHLVAITALAIRWVHLLVMARGCDRIVSPARYGVPEWPTIVLGCCYLAALALWLWEISAEWTAAAGACDFATLALVLPGVALRIAGQQALGRSFSWGSGAPGPSAVLSTTGIYRCLKHPLLLGYGLECSGMLAAVSGMVDARMAVAALLTGSLVVQAGREERGLLARFGTEWTEYAKGKLL